MQPHLVADEPAFDAVWAATQSRTPVEFDYRRSGLGEPTRRHVQPWGVVSARGRWYVVGHDSDRGEPRLFRLSRIVGDVATDGRPGSFVVPEGTDVRALTRSLAPEQPVGRATVRVRKGAAQDLRRRAVSTADAGEGWDVLELEYADLDTAAGEVLAALDAVVAVGPARAARPRRRPALCRRGDPGMSGAREQVARLLALVPYLNTHPEVALEQAARDFGVPAQQIVRDLKVLWYCGLPGLGPGDLIDIDMEALDSEEGDGMIRLSNAEYLGRPLRLGSSEAAALVVALRAMRESSPDTSRAAIDRVLAKLERATADGSAADVLEVPSHAADTAKVRIAVGEAIAGGRQVRLEYYVPTRDETTQRVVDPLALLEAEGHSYLDAWCHLAEARRLFRLDRVTGLEVLDEPALEHDVPPRDLSSGLFEPGPDDLSATVRLHRVARWVAEYYPVESQTELDDGGLEVVLRVGDPQWLVRLMMRLSPYARLVGPDDLRDRLRDEAVRVLAAYDASR